MPETASVPSEALPYPAPCCKDCPWKPCRYLGGSPRIRGFHYLGPCPRLPKECPAWLKNQTQLDLERVLQRLNRNELEELYRTGPPRVTGYPRRPEDSPLHLLAHEIPHHRESWLVVAPGSHLDHAVHALYWAYTRALARANPKRKKSEDADAAAAQSQEAEPALLNPGFAYIEDDTKPGSSESILTEAAIGDIVHFKVDTDGLMPGDLIHFELFRKGQSGSDEMVNTYSGTVGKKRNDHAAVAKWCVPEKTRMGPLKPGDAFYFKAKKSSPKLEVKSGGLKITEDDFDGCIFYSPRNEEYLMLEVQEDFNAFSTHVNKSQALRGKTAEAWKQSDSKARTQELEKVRKEWEALFEGKPGGDVEKGLDELLTVQKNPRWGQPTDFVHVPAAWRQDGRKIPGKWVKASDQSLQKRLDKLLKRNKSDGEDKSLWKGKLKAKLFESEPVVGGVWKWPRKSDQKTNPNDVFQFTPEAALGRYALGYSGKAEFDLKDKKISLQASGDASFALFEGKLSGKIFLPQREGLDLLPTLCNPKAQNSCRENNGQCLVRICIDGKAGLFVGLSANGCISFPAVDLSQDKKSDNQESKSKSETSAKADVHAVAGVQGTAGITFSAQWSPDAHQEFADLAEIEGELKGTAGAAADLSFHVSYSAGRFRFHFAWSLAWGLGGGSGLTWEVDAKQGCEFLGHLLYSVDSHYVKEIDDAFTAYKNYSFALVAESENNPSHGRRLCHQSGEQF